MPKISLLETKDPFSLGSRCGPEGVFFRVWAPRCGRVEVDAEGGPYRLEAEENGYFSGIAPGLKEGALYRFRLDGGESFPDPCSRFQPHGPHGPSRVEDPDRFVWHDEDWQKKGVELKGQVIYELHVGTFSVEGTYAGIVKELLRLKELGVTLIELMPLAEFPGRWNWGYDGVGLFAPAHVYGTPDDLRRLADEAHRLGLGILLDVVYNHIGPDGNYLSRFSERYFSEKHKTDWGEAINFDGEESRGVRHFFLENARYWIREFHFDGLRLDATQNIYDDGPRHILAEISENARKAAAPKKIIFVAENESQDVRLVAPFSDNGYGLDGLWNDDFHHAARVALTGRREAYFKDYRGYAQEFVSLAKYGYLYQGQFYSWQDQSRGTVAGPSLGAERFVTYLQNHDQISNSLDGDRVSRTAGAAENRALTAFFLLSPGTPLLFMGQEFGASTPFIFFADHNAELAPKVLAGRCEFLSQFPSIAAATGAIPDPAAESSFLASKLDPEELKRNKAVVLLHKDLLVLRRTDPVFHRQDRASVDGAVLSEKAWLLRFRGEGEERLLIVNLGDEVDFWSCPEPLLAPPSGKTWKLLWGSEETCYGGKGVRPVFAGKGWNIPPKSAHVFSTEVFHGVRHE